MPATQARRPLRWGAAACWVLGIALLGATLLAWFRVPQMSVRQVVDYPAGISVPAADAASLARLATQDGALGVSAAELESRLGVEPADKARAFVVTDTDPQRALAESDAISRALLAETPGAHKRFPDSTGAGAVGRDVAGGASLIVALAVAAAAAASARRIAADKTGAIAGLVALGASAMVAWLPGPGVARDALAGVALLAGVVALVRYGGWFRAALGVTLAATAFRSGAFSGTLPGSAWLMLQFGGLLAATGIAALEAATGPESTAAEGAYPFLSDRARRRVGPDPTGTRRRVTPATTFVAALLALCAWALMSSLWSTFARASAAQAILFGAVAAFLSVTLLTRWRDRGRRIGDLALVAATGALALLLPWLPLLPQTARWSVEPRTGRFVALTSNSNFAGALAAVTLLLTMALVAERGRARTYLAVTFLAVTFLALPLYATGSRGALLAVAVAVVVWLVATRAWRWLVTLALAGAAGVALLAATHRMPSIFQRRVEGHDVGPDSGRQQIYARALHLWREHPLLGHGYRTTEHLVETGQTAHNIELALLVELGAIGLLLFLVLVAALAWGAWRGRPNPWAAAALAGLLVEQLNSSLFGFSGPAALTTWLALAATAAAGARPVTTPPTEVPHA